MKDYFSADIEGRGFFRKYLPFYIGILAVLIVSNALSTRAPAAGNLLSLVQSYLSILLGFAFFAYVVPAVKFREEGFGFSGRMGEFAPKALKWYLLTIITLGIYSPWYIKNLMNYYLDKLSWKDGNGALQSRPGTLLKYMLLTLYIPIIVLVGLLVFFLFRRTGQLDYGYGMYDPAIAGLTFVFVIVIFLVMIPFVFFYTVWVVNIKFSGYQFSYTKSLSQMVGFLLPQILLTIITAGIYYPAFIVKFTRHVAGGVSLEDEAGADAGMFGFDGGAGQGFGMIWGRGLLTVITIGIYGPWAMARITNWFLNHTYIEKQ